MAINYALSTRFHYPLHSYPTPFPSFLSSIVSLPSPFHPHHPPLFCLYFLSPYPPFSFSSPSSPSPLHTFACPLLPLPSLNSLLSPPSQQGVVYNHCIRLPFIATGPKFSLLYLALPCPKFIPSLTLDSSLRSPPVCPNGPKIT